MVSENYGDNSGILINTLVLCATGQKKNWSTLEEGRSLREIGHRRVALASIKMGPSQGAGMGPEPCRRKAGGHAWVEDVVQWRNSLENWWKDEGNESNEFSSGEWDSIVRAGRSARIVHFAPKSSHIGIYPWPASTMVKKRSVNTYDLLKRLSICLSRCNARAFFL
jgi:hypothetical protein